MTRAGHGGSGRRFRRLATIALAAGLWLSSAPYAVAAERFAVIVTGASGGEAYAEKYRTWRTEFAAILKDTFGYPADHVTVLGEDEPPASRSTRENVRAALTNLRKRAVEGDLSVIFLAGHGSADTEEAKFNLVGPDLSISEWAALIKPIPGQVVFVNGSSGSFPFIEAIAGRQRVVLTANDSAAQWFETVFPGFFIDAFRDDAADQDKNGKVSLFEAFTFASVKVKDAFEQKGQLATERPMLDDTGAGVGRDLETTDGKDGLIAQVTYLQPEVPIGTSPEIAALLRQRAALEDKLTLLRLNKASMPTDRYEDELEAILIEIARLDRQLRSRT